MSEKKLEENTMPEVQEPNMTETAVATDIPKDVPPKVVEKVVTAPTQSPVPLDPIPVTVPVFTKNSPNDLYKKLLPAVLFVLTFVTVMAMLLKYMDAVNLGAQQFRLNMTRDYELSRISQESSVLVAYVRQLRLAPRVSHTHPVSPQPTRSTKMIDQLLGVIYNGTFVEWVSQGPRCKDTAYLEAARGWEGAVVRAAARDYYNALRAEARALHACLSPSPHPREVTYHESDGHETSAFSSRVLCLPLYTVLLAADATGAQYTLLEGDTVLPALQHVPFEKVQLQIIEYRSTDPVARNKTTQLLESKNYTVAASYDDSVMYALKKPEV